MRSGPRGTVTKDEALRCWKAANDSPSADGPEGKGAGPGGDVGRSSSLGGDVGRSSSFRRRRPSADASAAVEAEGSSGISSLLQPVAAFFSSLGEVEETPLPPSPPRAFAPWRIRALAPHALAPFRPRTLATSRLRRKCQRLPLGQRVPQRRDLQKNRLAYRRPCFDAACFVRFGTFPHGSNLVYQ